MQENGRQGRNRWSTKEADIGRGRGREVQAAFGYQGPEVFGVLARDCFRKNLRRIRSEAGGTHKEITVGPERRSGQLHGAGDQPVGEKTILNYIEVGKKEGKLLTGG